MQPCTSSSSHTSTRCAFDPQLHCQGSISPAAASEEALSSQEVAEESSAVLSTVKTLQGREMPQPHFLPPSLTGPEKQRQVERGNAKINPFQYHKVLLLASLQGKQEGKYLSFGYLSMKTIAIFSKMGKDFLQICFGNSWTPIGISHLPQTEKEGKWHQLHKACKEERDAGLCW